MPKIEKSKKDIVRIQFDVRRAQLDIIDNLVEECGLGSKKELFNNSMALMKWAIHETQKGRRVASYHVESDDIEMVALPALEFMEQKTKPAENVAKRIDDNVPRLRRVANATETA